MTTQRTHSTKQSQKTAYGYAVTFPEKDHVCGVVVALSQTVIRCSFSLTWKTELTPLFCDYYHARCIINKIVHDIAQDLARYATKVEAILRASLIRPHAPVG